VRRMESKNVDRLTTAHKLIGAAWAVCAIAVLVLVVPAVTASRDPGFWSRVVIFQRVAAYCSVATLVIGVVYGLWSSWGFVRYRQLILKWVLFLAATALNGPTITLAREGSALPVVALTAAEIVVLGACMAIGVFLERARHAGTMAMAPPETR
jgi:hypothetical protein